MSHFGLSFDEVLHEIPYQLIVFLTSSVPRYVSKEEREKPKDIRDILSAQMGKQE